MYPVIGFVIGFVAFTLLIAVRTAFPLLGDHPNLSLLFGLGSVNADRFVYVPKTSSLRKRAAWSVPSLLFLMWLTVYIFWRASPLFCGLILLGPSAALFVLFRYFQLALELDREGASETAKVKFFRKKSLDYEFGYETDELGAKYSYANGIEDELEDRYVYPLYSKNAVLRVTYLRDRPLIQRHELERLPQIETTSSKGKKRALKDWKSKIPQSGAARELVPRALKEFVRFAPSGGFIIFSHPKKTDAFVQFLAAENSLILDFPLAIEESKTAEAARARQLFAERHLEEMETSGVQEFPPAPDQIEQAARMALDIFERVFLMDGDTILKAEVGE